MTVEEYIANQPEPAQPKLRQVRAAIRKAIPKAEESISYNMPTYKMGGRPVIYFAGWKKHFSLYPATPELQEALKAELAPYKIEKGTIRFPLADPVPADLITTIAKLRARQAQPN